MDDAHFSELYQTRHGAYFSHHGDLSLDADNPRFMAISPLSPAEAQTWMERNASPDLIEAHFGEQPEAGDSDSRFTLRMPDALRRRIDIIATSNKQSLNAWIVRCLENCAGHAEKPR